MTRYPKSVFTPKEFSEYIGLVNILPHEDPRVREWTALLDGYTLVDIGRVANYAVDGPYLRVLEACFAQHPQWMKGYTSPLLTELVDVRAKKQQHHAADMDIARLLLANGANPHNAFFRTLRYGDEQLFDLFLQLHPDVADATAPALCDGVQRPPAFFLSHASLLRGYVNVPLVERKMRMLAHPLVKK